MKARVEKSHSRPTMIHRKPFFSQQQSQAFFPSPRIQPKLTVGQPGDKYEQEADQVADQVMHSKGTSFGASMPEPQVQRQPLEEEEEELQAKPLTDQITPLVQREEEPIQTMLRDGETIQRMCPECGEETAQRQPMEEEEEELQAKSNSGETPAVTPDLESRISSLNGGGQPLNAQTRSFFEPRFGHDLSHVRVHADGKANQLARSVNARAFTLGKNVVFGAREYQPQSREGKRLLGHELTHVVQQTQSGASNHISRWLAGDHRKLTEEVIDKDFKGEISRDARQMLAYYSGEIDIRGCNYLWFAPPKIPIIGVPVKRSNVYYKLSEHEAPNHGEANLYKHTNRTKMNEARMKLYQSKAVGLAKSKGINDHSLLELGMALHVGQDRGAHEEGLPGRGHARKNWNPDDLTKNTKGKAVAVRHSQSILRHFTAALDSGKKKQLKSKMLRMKSVEAGFETVTAVSLTQGKKLFFIGQYGYAVLPERLFGIWSPIVKAGYGYSGGEKHLLTMRTEAGLRLLRPTSRIYVDVLTGAAVGYNFTDKRAIAGVSAAVSAHYTGKTVDLGVILSNVYDVVGKGNVTVVGVSARW